STRLRDLSTAAWSPIGADAGGVAERVSRHLGAVREPHAVRSPELVDERLQHAKPRGPPGVLRVEDQHREPSHVGDAAELIAPHGQHGRRRENLSIEIWPKAEREERSVVENPRGPL